MKKNTMKRNKQFQVLAALSLLFFILLSGIANAADSGSTPMPTPPGLKLQKLVTISNDRNTNTSQLNVALNSQGEPQGVQLLANLSATGQPTATTKTLFYSVAAIESKDGVVLDTEDTHIAIILKGTISPTAVSDNLTLEYLENGLFGSYDSCQMVLEKSANASQWQILNSTSKQAVESIYVKSWKLGITTLQGICS